MGERRMNEDSQLASAMLVIEFAAVMFVAEQLYIQGRSVSAQVGSFVILVI
jgi:hypothetical protein